MKKPYLHIQAYFFAVGLVFVCSLSSISAIANESCYRNVDYAKPVESRAKRGLTILIDETVPLSKDMVMRVEKLLHGWGKNGDMVKIARFSASYRGLYPQLLYSYKIDALPDRALLYNLHYMDKVKIKKCIEMQRETFKKEFPMVLTSALKKFNPKIPKTELLGSLKLLSKKLVVPDDALRKTVLLISDGMENSKVISFYYKKNLRNIKPLATIAKLRRNGMMGFWKGVDVYMYGTGLMPDKKKYADPKVVLNLKRFWERYFIEGGAKSVEIGTPELLLTSID